LQKSNNGSEHVHTKNHYVLVNVTPDISATRIDSPSLGSENKVMFKLANRPHR
jgi:hypothetical protein